MRFLYPLVFALCCSLAGAAVPTPAAPTPTIIIDIHRVGAEALAKLKVEPSVVWSAEFGNELLLGVEAQSYHDWLSRPRVRAGAGAMSPRELLIRDHACVHLAGQSANMIVGGYEVLRQPPSSILYQIRAGLPVLALPENGVVSRELANEAEPVTPAAWRANVSQVVAQIDADRWFDTMAALSAFNRNSYSPNLVQSRDWILARFREAGLATQSFPFTLSGITSCTPTPPAVQLSNPIGVKQGRNLPNEWIVIGAHYDSRNVNRCDGTQAPQPGANDNASGCAGVIELARAFANVPTERSVLFMCFSGEEQGLVGSRRYVESLQGNGEITKVKHMINLDMIGFDPNNTRTVRIETRPPFESWLDTYAAAATTYAPELNLIRTSNAAAASDHWHFLQAGVPSMFTWQNGASIYPHYHRDTDLPQNMTGARPIAGGILKMDAAILADLAVLVPASVPSLFRDGFE